MIMVSPTLPGHAAELETLQRTVFPTLAEEERLHAPQYLRHLEVFPAGQFVILADCRVVGMTTTMRYDVSGTMRGERLPAGKKGRKSSGIVIYTRNSRVDPLFLGS